MSSCFFTCLCFFVFACTCIAPAFSITYQADCSSSSSPTISADELYSTLSFFTSYYTGGERLYGKFPRNTTHYYFVKKYARLQIQEHCETNGTGVYQVGGYLFIQFPYWYGGDDGGSGDATKTQGTVRFWFKGLWSENSRQLRMIGSASWVVEGNPFILDASLDLYYPVKNDSMLPTGYISGTLESMVSANVMGYFDPFSIFSFPTLPNYNYSLLSRAFGNTSFSSDSDVPENQWPSHEGHKHCWLIMGESIRLEVEYAAECRDWEEHRHCSPLGTGDGPIGSLPRLLLLTPIQCSAAARKLRYMATFQNTRYDQGFGLNSTLIGEASWDDEKKELSGIACRLFDPLNRSANEVGDCTMRLSLRYPSISSIRNDPTLVGRFRSTKHVEKSGYFRKINLTNADRNGLMTPPNLSYEYTELDRVRRWCTAKKPVKKGNTYPDVHSENMRLDMPVVNSRGEEFAWISATPLWIGKDLYQKKNTISVAEVAEISEPHSTSTSYSNISYMIWLNSSPEMELGYLFGGLNWSSTTGDNEVEITAEGVYNAETGYLCMVGCRKLGRSSYSSRDCEILVTLEFAPLSGKGGGHTQGTITSKRAKTDPLYFDDMTLHSPNYFVAKEVSRSLWRMDLEIAMVLISNTLACFFVAHQIRHVKRNPEVPSSVSLLMLLIVSVGNMIPLVSNFEFAYLRRSPVEKSRFLGYGGMLEANEVAVRLSSLVALLLQIRLLQLVYTAKQRDDSGKSLWIGERKSGCVWLSLYVSGVLLALLVNWMSKRHVNEAQTTYIAGGEVEGSVWGGVRSYGGLFLDGFLLPQVLLNAFRGSAMKSLCHPFYAGISALRLVPRAYNQYRALNYPVPKFKIKSTYYYANPAIGFYSRAWDIMIPLGILTFAIIVFLQQRCGGRRLTFLLKA